MKTLDLNSTYADHPVSDLLGHIKKKIVGMQRGAQMAAHTKDKAGHKPNYVSPLMDLNLPCFEILCSYALQSGGIETPKRPLCLSQEIVDDLGTLQQDAVCGSFFGKVLSQLCADLQDPARSVSKKFMGRLSIDFPTEKKTPSDDERHKPVTPALKADLLGGDIVSDRQLGPSSLDSIFNG